MPKLTKEQLEQVKYVSIQDYCKRVDEIESVEDKLAFTTRYILSYGQEPNANPDAPIEKIIKVAHMKIADKSADLKSFYHETDVNRGIAELMVDPTVSFAGQDLGNQMFIANPVGYLKGQAKAIEDEIRRKNWKDENDIKAMANCGTLRNQVFTDEFGARIAEEIKKPTVFDLNARLENAFGGPAALKKAYEATKPGVFSSLFGTSSVAATNLDAAYKAFNNPNNANHGNMPTVEKAAKEYLQHVLPDWKPDRLKNIPTAEDIAHLKGTQKARALLSLNLLNAVKQQKEMEDDYKDMIDYAEKKNIAFEQIHEIDENKLIIEDNQSDFQKDVQNDIQEKNEVEEVMKDLEEAAAGLEGPSIDAN